ncbi:hypothetical protein EI42_05693 [Thermosporothrix hazakensis]|uniref:Uncharacterized protein n=2 Tax=Thermosporothrix TaxID=768650 RepID=A0A326U5G6_THEHA|nr:hypothetical protein EI42_05693 [Thermosporothrix hazakensis]BBH88171.1 hypothetical protein KTC_29220 [Thermosporothrix sp. COM3]GCE46360.1 hypothetical protein KTH_12290 [Thermosporothrix hazakensis]
MASRQKKPGTGRTLLLGIICAFVLGVLLYVGNAFLPMINMTRLPEPGILIVSFVMGGLFALVLRLLQRSSRQ